MGNSLYQIVENGEIKVHLYPLSYPFFSSLVVLYLLYHLFPSLLLISTFVLGKTPYFPKNSINNQSIIFNCN